MHKLTMDCAKSELTKCEKAGMGQEEFAESKKPVYITLMDELEYEDVS